jgi:site-specific recombinase XerD
MINRQNWLLVCAYLEYRRDVELVSTATVHLAETWLSNVLVWADESHFSMSPGLRPSFPAYMRDRGLSPIYTAHVIRAARRFFLWVSKHRFTMSEVWLDTLRLPSMLADDDKKHEAVTIEEVRAIASAPVFTIRERRIRASAVFWFLSGIRIGAFVTLPVSAVELDKLTVNQFPRLGVRTKFRKHATTFLLNIPDLLEVVRLWDIEVRSAGSRFWFAMVDPDTGLIDASIRAAGNNRHVRARHDLRDWLARVGLSYHSPHKFRHGFAVYALKQAKTVKTLKAISQNLMHTSLKTTDSIYSILDDLDVQEEINAL